MIVSISNFFYIKDRNSSPLTPSTLISVGFPEVARQTGVMKDTADPSDLCGFTVVFTFDRFHVAWGPFRFPERSPSVGGMRGFFS